MARPFPRWTIMLYDANVPVGSSIVVSVRTREITFTSTVDGGAPQLLGYELEFTCAAAE